MSAESITIVENDTIHTDDSNISAICSQFFSTVFKNLNIVENSDVVNHIVNDLDPVNRTIVKYENHPSILKIKEVCGNQDTFSFIHCTYENMCDEIRSLNISKACPKNHHSIKTNQR